MASVTYDQVTKRFGDSLAVDNLSISIQDGEFMVLVGPSGCGKTTTLRMLAGLDEVTSGAIMIGERVVNDVSPQDRDVAMVFQSYALYPHMSVFDNMAFGLKMRRFKGKDVDSQVQRASQMLGLDSVLRRKPRQLSGGQRQRVAVGRAIVRKPEVFLLDEPLSNLDAQLRVQTRIELQRQHRALGTTFIYVTHDQVEAMTMGDRLAVMRDGVLQQCAAPRDIYNKPKNLYVAGFIGSPQMNFIPVNIEEGRRAKASNFSVDLPYSVEAKNAVLGIRPEALTDRRRDEANSVMLKADVVEILGSDQLVYGTCGSDNLVARVEPSLEVKPGDVVPLWVDLRQLHLFDAKTEEAIAGRL